MKGISFWIIQLIGVLAFIVLVASYYRKDTNKILAFHILAFILYCLHYFLLGANTGVLICFYELIRDSLYLKTDADKYIFFGSIPICIFGTFLMYKSYIDILPLLSSIIDGYTLTKNKKIVIIGAVISYSAWVIYNINVGSYSGVVTEGILVLSNLSILIFNKGLFGEKDIRKV